MPATDAARIEWVGKTGVTRFRLQIASDEQFSNVIFDGVVDGSEYLARDLEPGHYYWRVAPAKSPGRQFLKVAQFEVRSVRAEKPPPSFSVSPSSGPLAPGWFTTTGEISTPIAAQLRTESDLDFIGVNSEGTVYALDGLRGIALWTARYHLSLKHGVKSSPIGRQFVPLIVSGTLTGTNHGPLIVVAYEKGLRALEAATGREVWSSELPGIVGGLAADITGGAEPVLYLADDSRDQLVGLNARTGSVESVSKLSGKPVGAPVLLATKNSHLLLLPLDGGQIDVIKDGGQYVRSVKTGSAITTSPVIVETSRGVLMLVGTKDGLAAFDATEFQPLGRIAVEKDFPIGSLSVSDEDRDGRADIVVMVTNLGRVSAASLSDGKIKWFVEGFDLAAAATFVDLNGDGRLELILPGKNSFAIGLSGDDGSKIWESPSVDPSNSNVGLPVRTRRLATATMKDGRVVIVGNDASSMGLRAIELPRVVATPAQK